ncbi:phage/plasmid primase, P4 family, C-terminal domain-containing protein [Novosphingobium sp. CF614]|uniref:phage/plasmid primase, P4 family n=1 Tax=Novosphingobium sp. CF614 TaxID=1884364 RepID=UPI0008EF6135|nr:phage/plasmid primase, P4 family [Novosphingobium sp. CF614]SFG33441.1 phage/plasmid primase, P4 family, C-terminal domain-containing protein [Novosphingobium sp. CF614]
MTAKPSTNTGTQAVEYVRHSLAVCAIPLGRKGPTAIGWNLLENAITCPTAAATLTGNVGLLHAWSGTMALDVDDWGAASEWLLARGVNLAQLFTASDRVEIASGRAGRAKLLFRLPAGLHTPVQTLQVKGGDSGMTLEFRCADASGNSMQDVLPPSIHPDTGKPYQWGGSGDWRNLPVIPEVLLQVWQGELAKRTKGSAPAAPLTVPPAFAPQSFAPHPGFATLEENLWGVTVVESALDHVSPDTDYPTWRNISWAIMSTGWKSAPQIVHGWSQCAPFRYDRAATDTLIRSFDPTRGITLATLFHHAKQNGWTTLQQYPLAVVSSPPQSSAPGYVTPYHPVDWSVHGDIRNARHFAAMFGGRMLYVHGHNEWLRWSNDRWVVCDQGQEIEAVKQAAQAMMADAAFSLSVDQDRGKGHVREAVAAHRISRMKAALELAQSGPGMSTGPADLDANPMLLGVGNGVVDLKVGALIANRPEMLITRHCAADYDMAAACPRWLQFMSEVFGGDLATIDTVQRLLGYTLTGLNTEEIIVFCSGFGANGKSIFGNIVNRILASYSKVAPHSLLAARRRDDHGPRGDIAMLEGARLVSVNELPGGMQLDEQSVKALAGREPISARELYERFRTFEPQFTVWVRTNHRPIIKGDDDGIWRRIVVLPFRQKFEGPRCDKHLEAKLWAERDGILHWMIEGAGRYLALNSLAFSPTILAEQRQYRRDSDLLGEFLADCTVTDPAGRVPDKELFGRWRHWCDVNGHKAGGKATFTQRLAERGFPISRSNGDRFYSGVRGVP